MAGLTGATRLAFLAFFTSHIPATLMIDLQALLPASFYPQTLKDLLKWYTITFKDSIMTPPYDIWLSSVFGAEMIFQLPFFFVAVYALLYPERIDGSGSGWFKPLCLVYGSHVATTLLPLLAVHATNPDADYIEKAFLILIYLPYLIFPLWLIIIAFVNEDILGQSSERKKAE
jgi:hypothetical protein